MHAFAMREETNQSARENQSKRKENVQSPLRKAGTRIRTFNLRTLSRICQPYSYHLSII